MSEVRLFVQLFLVHAQTTRAVNSRRACVCTISDIECQCKIHPQILAISTLSNTQVPTECLQGTVKTVHDIIDLVLVHKQWGAKGDNIAGPE